MIVHILNAALQGRGACVIAVAQAACEHRVLFCIRDAQAGDVVRFLHEELAVKKQH